MGADLAVKGNEFEDKVLKSEVPVLVDFWATWCGPCLRIGPAIEELATEFSGQASVVKVDVDGEPDLAARYGIMSIPALLVFKGGKEVERLAGAYPKDQIAAMIKRHL